MSQRLNRSSGKSAGGAVQSGTPSIFVEDNAQQHRVRRRRLRHWLVPVVVAVLFLSAMLFLALRKFEKAVTFHPVRYSAGERWKLPAGGADVWFKSADGVRLHGWFVRGASNETSHVPATTVLYFHGNGGNLNGLGWIAEDLSVRGFDVLLFDYRGYGQSEGEMTDEHGLYADADAAYDYLTHERGVLPERLALYGKSLGTVAAVDVASRRPCAALVLESGLSSAGEMAGVVLPWLPKKLRGLGYNRLDSASKIARVNCPVLITHGTLDRTIPVAQAHILYDAAHEPKRLLIIEGAGHNDVSAVAGPDYFSTLEDFIRRSIQR
jgi:fermentation-respiration switch protein FrsA (DUF1100 family)